MKAAIWETNEYVRTNLVSASRISARSSSPAITLGIYAHLIDQAEHARRATERFDEGYGHLLNPVTASE